MKIIITTVGERLPWVKKYMLPQLPGAHVQVDWKRNNVWPATRRALHMHAGEDVLLLQDDIILCPNFLAVVRKTQAAAPRQLITYFGAKMLPPKMRRGGHWALVNCLITAQANLFPWHIIDPMLLWIQQNIPDTWKPHYDDLRIMHWQLHTNTHALMTLPELVDHDVFESTDPQRMGKVWRACVRFQDYSVDEIDWTLPAHPQEYKHDLGAFWYKPLRIPIL